ncbi:MAG TPA: T9SS type A sorting domain-containing protein [bacterium]|nr:T9SS type A sorting domain-containing protein [bacterium]
MKYLQMMSHSRHLLALGFFMPALLWGQVQWPSNGISIQTLTASSPALCAVPDGQGGAFLAWADSPLGDLDIYAQRVDGTGTPMWSAALTRICTDGGDQKFPAIAADGSGGVFVAWQDELSGKIAVKHLDADGNVLQLIDPCTASGEQTRTAMISDGRGGVILVWTDKRNGSSSDLYAQRINGSGTLLWGSQGTAVTTAPDNQSNHAIISDGQGGVVAVWQDYRNLEYDIYAQRIDSSGTALWSADGIEICTYSDHQLSPVITQSDTLFIIAWQDNRNGNSDVYAQALSSEGVPLWSHQGIPVCTELGTQMQLSICPGPQGGAILTWSDNRNMYDIYAQALSADGSPQWQTGGMPVIAYEGYQYQPQALSNGAGGAFVIWLDNRTMSDLNLYAQQIDMNGNRMWAGEGVPVTVANGTQQSNRAVSDGSGGFFAFWHDQRGGGNALYGQYFNENLAFSSPNQGALWAGGSPQTIRWSHRDDRLLFDHYSIHLSTYDGDGFPHLIGSGVNPSDESYAWIPESLNSATARVRITARDFRDSALCSYDSRAFMLDSNPPEFFELVSPTDGASEETQPTFVWRATTDNLSGVNHYELWINGNLVQDNLSDTSYTLTLTQALTPGTCTWNVRAVDRAGLIRETESRTLYASQDNTPPEPFSLLSPAHNQWTTDTRPSFTWQTSTDEGTGLKKYQLYVNGFLKEDDIPPSTPHVATEMPSGSHSWYVLAVDSADNTRRSTETWIVRIDYDPPMPFDLIAPADNVWTQNSTPRLTWEASRDTSTGIGLARYQCWINYELHVDNIPGDSTSITLGPSRALNQGIHSWMIVAIDSLGNCRESTSTFTLKIDNTAPEPFELIRPVSDSLMVTVNPEFEWEPANDALSGILEYRLRIDNEIVASLQSTSTMAPTPLAEGNHTWSVEAVDIAGNLRSTAQFAFLTDTTRPEPFDLVSPYPDEILHTSRPAFTWRSTDDALSGMKKFEFYINGFIQKDSLSMSDTTWTVTQPIPNGRHYWKVKAWDNAGNVRLSDYYFFTIECRPPVITSPASVTATEDIPFSYTATAEDPDGDDLSITFHHLPQWLSVDSLTVHGTPLHGHQDTTFLIIADDGFYRDSLRVSVQVIQVNDPPCISEFSNIVMPEDSSVVLPFTVWDEETHADNLTVWAVSSNTDLIPDSGLIITGTGTQRNLTITPSPDSSGTSHITVGVSDGNSTTETVFTVEVTPVNDPPRIVSSDSVEATQGRPFVYRPEIEDIDGPELFITFIRYPRWLTPSGPEIYGTPPSAAKDTCFTVIASDGQLTDTLKVHITVHQVNAPPQFIHALPRPVFQYADTLVWSLVLSDYIHDPDDPDSTLNWSHAVLDTHDVCVAIDSVTHEATLRGIRILGQVRIAFTVTDPHSASATDTLFINSIKTDVENTASEIPAEFMLHPNYPNPFNPTTTLRYSLPRACKVRIHIFNLLGREIAVLRDEMQPAGIHEVLWDAGTHPSGIYFVRIHTESWNAVRRLLLMK